MTKFHKGLKVNKKLKIKFNDRLKISIYLFLDRSLYKNPLTKRSYYILCYVIFSWRKEEGYKRRCENRKKITCSGVYYKNRDNIFEKRLISMRSFHFLEKNSWKSSFIFSFNKIREHDLEKLFLLSSLLSDFKLWIRD